MNIQAPPNLMPDALEAMIAAGINDWGGVSPVTPDHVNPEAPWPALDLLAQRTAAAGKLLVERLAIYPEYAADPARWLDPALRTPTLRAIDTQGLARTDPWSPGADTDPPARRQTRGESGASSHRWNRSSPAPPPAKPSANATSSRLFEARGDAFDLVCATADRLRREVNGDTVSYVVTRNINYTNICYFRCQFCAFSKGKLSENLRGRPYNLDMDEIVRRCEEAWERGATEVCLQGGIHPEYTGATYLGVCRAIKQAVPGMHVHAFSPLEIWQGAKTLGRTLPDFLAELRDAGLELAARHRGRNPRRRGARDHLPGQGQDRRMAGGDGGGARGRPAGHGHDHVRPCRPLRALGAAPAAGAGAAGAHRRLHRVRAAAVRADGSADLAEGPRPARSDLSRGGADACRRAPGAAPADPQHPDARGSSSAATAPPPASTPGSTISAAR